MPAETARPVDCSKLRAIIQAYLNTNKTWIVNDFRETDPIWFMLERARAKAKAAPTARARAKERARIAIKARAKARSTAKARSVENLTMTKNAATCAEKRVISHETVDHEQITTRW